ncbi:MAG: sigma-70 family RNA polymerase sigma factor [Acidobacteria bacterium]|nr:sigma-70 family RNA polymerase sigma factor [Acidobacteriota bacterium]
MEPQVAKTDEEWMLRLQAGDDHAFDHLLGKYRAPVVHFVYRLVREPALAEELAQEVFLRVFRARRSYRPRAKFTTWLFRIATNVALNALRDGRMRRWGETSIDAEDAGPQVAQLSAPGPTAEQRLLEAERARQIRAAVESLPEKQRLAVLLHKYQDLDYAEIAPILGCSESALKSLLFRAYEALRVKLRPLAGAQP